MNDFNFAQAGRAPAGAMDMSVDAGLRSFMLGVYNKMALGLALTAGLAFAVASIEPLFNVIFGTPLRFVVMFGPLAILFGSAFFMKNPSPAGANIVYWSVASLIGVSMAMIVAVYSGIQGGMTMVAQAFLTTAIAFGGLSLWGYTTKKDLTGWGTFLIMGVIGLIVIGIGAMFFGGLTGPLAILFSVVGLLLFAGLTAYDTQQLKFQYYELGGSERALSVATTFGALSLYINFVNMFQFILSLMSMFAGDD